MSEPVWMATTNVVFVEPDGTQVPGSIRISRPEPVSDDEAQCSYNLDPITPARAIRGVDELQALLLALRMCGAELALFARRGGRIEYPSEDDGTPGGTWDPAATFGAFFQAP